MATVSEPRGPVTPSYRDPEVLRYTTDYFIKLLVERHAIRSALVNPGASIVLTGTAATTEQTQSYSSVLGNEVHLDLLDAEQIVNELPVDQRRALLDWIDGLTSAESARFASVQPSAIRNRRARAIEAAGKKWAVRHREEE